MITAAKLQWQQLDNGSESPYSEQYGDIYFRGDGIEESDYVFIQANQLTQRWQNQSHFCIAELGFGTGLNFLLTWRYWNKTKATNTHERLTYIAIDKHPLGKDDLLRAQRQWWRKHSNFKPLSEQLISHYPFVHQGFHLVPLANNVDLILIWDDVGNALQQLLTTVDLRVNNAKVDCWFADGFSPNKNQAMWQPSVFQLMAILSRDNATLSTFTAATAISKGLQQAGFEVTKIKGFRHKREMITAHFNCSVPNTITYSDVKLNVERSLEQLPNWHIDYQSINQQSVNQQSKIKEVTIVGAGISGCCAALALARRGWQVTLIDKHHSVGGYCESSSTLLKQIALYAKLSIDATSVLGQFALAALSYASRFYQTYWSNDRSSEAIKRQGQQCSLAQLATSSKQEQHYQQLVSTLQCYDLVTYKNAADMSDSLGVTTRFGGLWFEHSGWLEPEAICTHLIQHDNILWCPNTEFSETFEEQKIEPFHPIIYAVAGHYSAFDVLSDIPIKLLAGQIDYIKATQSTLSLKSIICSNHTLIPANLDGLHYLGSSYRQSSDIDYSKQESKVMSHAFDDVLQQSLNQPEEQQNIAFSQQSIRATTPDFIPMVGALAEKSVFEARFSGLQFDAKKRLNQQGSFVKNRYLMTGMGSRGFCYAPLCAEVLAAELSNEPAPVPLNLVRALQPARFVLRNIAKRRSD